MNRSLALLIAAGTVLVGQPAAFSQPAPGETGNSLAAVLPGETGGVGARKSRAVTPGETGNETLAVGLGETGPDLDQLALLDPIAPGESGPPPVSPNR